MWGVAWGGTFACGGVGHDMLCGFFGALGFGWESRLIMGIVTVLFDQCDFITI